MSKIIFVYYRRIITCKAGGLYNGTGVWPSISSSCVCMHSCIYRRNLPKTNYIVYKRPNVCKEEIINYFRLLHPNYSIGNESSIEFQKFLIQFLPIVQTFVCNKSLNFNDKFVLLFPKDFILVHT